MRQDGEMKQNLKGEIALWLKDRYGISVASFQVKEKRLTDAIIEEFGWAFPGDTIKLCKKAVIILRST